MIDTRQQYQAWHDRYPVDAEADAPWHRLVKAHLRPDLDLASKRVLEIGCGRGGFACWLARGTARPAQFIAADFAVSAVSKGRAFSETHHIDGITWQVADIQRLPLADATIDTAISCETIEHVPDPARAVAELARVLRPGGRLYLTTPNYFGIMGLYRMYVRARGRVWSEEGQPINNLTMLPRTRRWVTQAGLTVARIDGIGHYLPFPRRPPIEMAFLNQPRFMMRWLALHSLVVALKPA